MEPNQGADADVFPEGVQPLDHTADIGMDVRAPSLPQMFRRAAAGLVAFTCPRPGGTPPRSYETVQLQADDTALLLVGWLRELLFLMERRGLCFVDAEFPALSERALTARVALVPCSAAIREIKGITYHELDVRREAGGWRARVIFDV